MEEEKLRPDDEIKSIWKDGKYEILNIKERVRLCDLIERGEAS